MNEILKFISRAATQLDVAGARAVPGSQHVRTGSGRGSNRKVRSRLCTLRAGDGSRYDRRCFQNLVGAMRCAACVLLALLAAFSSVRAQDYTIDWYKVAGGGGTSTGNVYSVSGTIGQHDAGGPMTGGNYSLTGGFWSLFAVQTVGAPRLFITRSGNNAVIYWSASAAGFVLEHKNSVAVPGGWSPVSPVPVTVSGFQYVTNTVAPGNNFYRLRHP